MSGPGMDLAVLAHSPPDEGQSIGVSGACLWLIEGEGAKALGRALGLAARQGHATLWDWLDAATSAPGVVAGPCAGACVMAVQDGMEASVFGEAALALASESEPESVRVWEDPRLSALLAPARRGLRALLASGQGVAGALRMSEPAVERCAMLADCAGGWPSLSTTGRGLAQACWQREAVPLSLHVALASTALVRAVRSDEAAVSWDDVLSSPPDGFDVREAAPEAIVHRGGPCLLRFSLARRGQSAA